MKITDVQVIPLSFAVDETSARSFGLVKVSTDSGVYGIGEMSDSYGHSNPLAAKEIIEKALRPLLLQQDPLRIEEICERLQLHGATIGLEGLVIQAISGVEIALWDIAGKEQGKPVYELLGGSNHPRVRVYASTTVPYPSKPADHALAALRQVEQGFNAVKIRVGVNEEWDEMVVNEVRDAVGPDVLVLVDVYMHYKLQTAIKMAKKFEKYDIYFLEEPIPSYDVSGLAEIASAVEVPIAVGEHVFTRFGFENLLLRKAADILQPDCSVVGGLLEAKRVCELAAAQGIDCVPHSYNTIVNLAATMHLAASVKNCPLTELDVSPFNPLRDDLPVERIKVHNGYVELPTGPGLGVELKDAVLRKYAYQGTKGLDKLTLPMERF